MLQKIINKLNDLRPKQLLALASVAAILMFITIYIGMSLLTKQEIAVQPEEQEEKKTPVIETSSVVVAKVNIPSRTRIQDSMLQMKEIPVELIPEGSITNFDELKDVQVKSSIFAGDVLTNQKVFNDIVETGFIGTIPPDCRAVSINVNEITGVAGFARPGDKVDLILVEKGDYSATTNVLLQNVPLLSVNQDTEEDNSLGSFSAISNPTIATLALRPEEVMKLISASKLGEIYMSLRPSNPETEYLEPMQYTIESVNSPKSAVPTPVIPSNPTPEMPVPQIPEVPATPKIEIIQGDQIVQSAEEPVQQFGFSADEPSMPASELPAIPSRKPAFNAPTLPDTPLSNSNIAHQIGRQ